MLADFNGAGGEIPPTLRRLIPTSTMEMEEGQVRENIRKCFERNLPRLCDSGLLFKFKHETPLAIVAGGPSLNRTVHEMNDMTIMVCGSAHDHLVNMGIRPDYCVLVDPDDLTAKYIQSVDENCTYLVASQCSDAVFDRLKDSKVLVWNCGGFKDDDEIYHHEPRIGGGCTVTLRAISLGIVMGYGNQHFFGFDSCLFDDRTHAYNAEPGKQPLEIYLDGSPRKFLAEPYMLAQAAQFQDMLRNHGHLFTPTIHGDGLIAEIMKIGKTKAKEITNAA